MDSDYPDDALQGENYEEEESAYPNIDENVHYPWQNDQSFDIGSMLASVIDPRLFGDQPTQQPQNISQHPSRVEAQAAAEAEAEYASSDEYENQEYPPVSYPPVPGAAASSDEEFVLSGEDESARYVWCGRNV
jgi:general transcription factor 3C polypeptide 3 (transcription factor C subunit 4)